MSRSRRIASRALFAVLAVVIVLGLVSYFHNVSKSNAEQTAADNAAPTPPAQDQPAPPAGPQLQPGALVTATPLDGTGYATVGSVTPPTPPAAPAQSAKPQTPAATPAPAPRVTPLVLAVPADKAVAEGKRLLDAGELLKGRDVLNAALVSGQLSASDAAIARQLIQQANQEIIFSRKTFPDDPWQDVYTVQSGDLMVRIANRFFTPYEFICKINGNIDPRRIRPGQKLKVIKGPFHAVVNMKDFRMDLYLGSPGGSDAMYVMSFPVGLGADNSTPTGLWVVPSGAKARNPVYYSPRGEGIIAADDPKNPLGEHWIALEGIEGNAVGAQSYGIHGTIEPESIGKQASMGCIRLHNDDVAQVFEMLYEVKSHVRTVE